MESVQAGIEKDTAPKEERVLTFGEKAVGFSFNPSGDPMVTAIKHNFANIITALDTARKTSESPEVKRMYSVAITDAQAAQMWAVKAATWKD